MEIVPRMEEEQRNDVDVALGNFVDHEVFVVQVLLEVDER